MMKNLLIFYLLIFPLIIPLNYIDLNELEIAEIKVTIKGDIKNEKTITIPKNSIMQDVIKFIEFNNPEAKNQLNPLQVIYNNDVINIPKIKTNQLISINLATIDELCSLPGIKEKTAQKIIDYRLNNGMFQNINDLMNVKSIGEKKFNKIKAYICL